MLAQAWRSSLVRVAASLRGVPSADPRPLQIAYVVSRYPSSSETFIVRELNALSTDSRLEIALLSLFPPNERFTHESGRPWLSLLRRPAPVQAFAALGYWLVHSPRVLVSALVDVVRACRRSPALLVRSLVAVALASAHARALAREPVDHVHAHFATFPALAAWMMGRLTGASYSFTAHAHDLFVDASLLSLCLPEARFVVAISRFNRDFVERRRPGSTPQVHVIRCGIEPSAYPFRPRSIPAHGPVRALCVASLQEHKGHAVLLQSLASRGEGLDRIEVGLVGAGPLRNELEVLASRLGIAERVRFLGPLDERDVAKLLDDADLFVLPSRVAADGQMEGLPVALIEAAAGGVPIVASRLSGIPELIRDGVTGYLAEPGDVESLSQTLVRCLATDAKVDLAAARALVEQEFAVQGSAARLADLFLAERQPIPTEVVGAR